MTAKQREQTRLRVRAWRARKYKDPVWLAEHRKKESARMSAYYKEHPEERRKQWKKFVGKHGVERRAKERVRNAIKAVTTRGFYKPVFSRRKPDWVPVGESGIDTSSPWIENNITDSQRDFARELAIERRNRSARHD